MNTDNECTLTLRKRKRLINSKIRYDSREILVSAKTADISRKINSEFHIQKVNSNPLYNHENTCEKRDSNFTISESSSSEDFVGDASTLQPTVSASSDSDDCTRENVSSVSDSENFLSENDVFSESDDSSSDSESEININEFLRDWFLSFKILPLIALTTLLKGLRNWFPTLPADARTLLQTPRSIDFINVGNGQFYNFGLNEMLINKLGSMSLANVNTLHFNVNIDGLPLHRSSNAQFWPILITLQEDPQKKPFVVSIFHGKTKPPLNDFIMPFISEFNKLEQVGLNFKGKVYNVKIRCFICDAPAKAYIKGIKGHTGYYGCDKCIQTGIRVNRVQTFPETDACRRTNDSFRLKENPEHHKYETPLLNLNIDLIKAFPHDYMHLVCLGVMRRLLYSWAGKTKSRNGRIASQDIISISSLLIDARNYWPSDFNREPRGLLELDYWKATEFRQFLLYLGPVYLKSILQKDLYRHFLLLHCSISILGSSDLHLTMNDTAQTYLKKFVELAPKYYGSEILSYNMHSLVHLNEDVLNFGILDSFSAFPFENHLQELKNMVSKSNKPLQQLCKRVLERKNVLPKQKISRETFNDKYIKEGSNSEIVGKNYSRITYDSYKLTDKPKDNCVLLKQGKIVIASSFLKAESAYIIGQEFTVIEDFFSKPCKSSILNIYRVKNLSKNVKRIKLSDIKCKMVLLPYKSNFVALPLHHLI